MHLGRRTALAHGIRCAAVLTWLLTGTAGLLLAGQPEPPGAAAQSGNDPSRPASVCMPAALGSPYIPLDSWVYPAMLRLYGLGFVDNMFLDLRPWTRASV